MSKEQSPDIYAYEDTVTVADILRGAAHLPMSGAFGEVITSVDDVLTQVLENNLHHFESLRASIEEANRKQVDDVRDTGDSFGCRLLRGIEANVDYHNLVDLIQHMKQGLARRRVLPA